MIEDPPPARCRRMSANGMIFRRRRVLARLREGLTYDEIAGEEGVSRERIRQIASEVLQKRTVDSGADHAKLQLDRLAPAVQLGAEAIAAGDVSAITPYLRALDRLDRYQSAPGAHQVYDDEARKKLMERINRMAENLGVDEVMWNAMREHLKAIGAIPADEPGEAEGAEAPAGSGEAQPEGPSEAQPEDKSEAAAWMSV
jgi:transcriptional regulator with XRE-family HTH domain